MNILEKLPKTIEHWELDRLIPYVGNARTHSDSQVEQIAASIREFGFTNPILVDGDNGIIAGHGRLMAAQRLGLEQVPVIVLGYLTDAQRRAYILADNKLALNAGWDFAKLTEELAGLQDDDFDLSLIGFSDDELADLLPDVSEAEMPKLKTEDRQPIQQMTFTLHDDQVAEVERALELAKQMGAFENTGNENSNGNALARVCELFVGHHGNG